MMRYFLNLNKRCILKTKLRDNVSRFREFKEISIAAAGGGFSKTKMKSDEVDGLSVLCEVVSLVIEWQLSQVH